MQDNGVSHLCHCYCRCNSDATIAAAVAVVAVVITATAVVVTAAAVKASHRASINKEEAVGRRNQIRVKRRKRRHARMIKRKVPYLFQFLS